LARHLARRPCHDRDDVDASLDRSSMAVPASQRSSRFRRGVLQDPTASSARTNFHALALGWSHWQARTRTRKTPMAMTAKATTPMTPTTASAAQNPHASPRP
jgi:hypothetical protein